MNRRSFIRSLPAGGLSLALTGEALSAAVAGPVARIDLSGYATPYTRDVGSALLRGGEYTAVLDGLNRRLVAGSEAQAARLHAILQRSIERACREGRFWEVDGWVVTPAEAMLSALIVQGSD